MVKIILIGPRSVGKTTVGKLLAKKLKVKYIDLDDIVDRKLGGITEHIDKKGMESYRKKERIILKKLLAELPKKFVVSVGGGTIASQFIKISELNVKDLKRKGKLVYLCPADTRKESIKILRRREMKRGGQQNYLHTLKIFKLRRPIYEEIYYVKIVVKEKSPLSIANQIIKGF